MIYKSKIYFSLINLFCYLFFYNSVIFAQQSCENLFINKNLTDCFGSNCSEEYGFGRIGRFGYNIPIFSKFLKPKISELDVNLLRMSYENSQNGNPIEYGSVQFYDKANNLIASSGLIRGRYGAVSLNNILGQLLIDSRSIQSKIDRIVVKHTHPQDYKNDSPERSTAFSDADIISGNIRRNFLNKQSLLKDVKLENYIIFFNPDFISGRTFYPVSILSDYQFCLTNKIVTVIGYRL